MHIGARDLLRKLGAGVRPAGVRVGEPRDPFELRTFGAMLDEVRAGAASGRAVGLAPDAGVALTHDELAELAGVADAAEAAGIAHVLAFMGERALRLDVPGRVVVGGASSGRGLLVRGIDAVVLMGEADAPRTVDTAPRVVEAQDLHGMPHAEGTDAPYAPLGAIRNASLLGALCPDQHETRPHPARAGVQED